jgi:AraC-like DNA-binding protein
MGRSIFDPIWAEEQHVSQGSELMHVLRGSVKVETPGYSIAGREGDTIYTPRGVPHRDVFPAGSVFEVYLVIFDWPDEPAMLERFEPRQLAQLGRETKARVAEDFAELYQDFLANRPFNRELTRLRLQQIIFTLCRDAAKGAEEPPRASHDGAARRHEIMTQAKRVIDERLSSPLGLEDIADALSISPFYLSRVFSQESGFTLSSYLTRTRMEKAAELLRREPTRKIAAVAAEVGFRDAHYFGRVFRGHFGVSPAAFRVSRKSREQ